jgi:hypothetical protein
VSDTSGASDAAGFGYGQQTPEDTSHDMAVIAFIVRQMMSQMRTNVPVKVVAVHGGGGAIAAAGTVDVQPLISQVDGNFNATPHGTVSGIPWWRLQGGSSAVICDPLAGDFGYVAVSDRDMSSVKANKGAANPGSRRKYDLADGIYVGGILGAAPTQYLVFTSSGIQVVDLSGNQMTLSSTGINFKGNVTFQNNVVVQGSLNVTGDTVSDGVDLKTHVHSGVTTGGGDSGPPV